MILRSLQFLSLFRPSGAATHRVQLAQRDGVRSYGDHTGGTISLIMKEQLIVKKTNSDY